MKVLNSGALPNILHYITCVIALRQYHISSLSSREFEVHSFYMVYPILYQSGELKATPFSPKATAHLSKSHAYLAFATRAG